ncbi:MAG TPA: biotin/lipoyl-containing protein, partial [Fibrobacteria bacterium]|nr:biotin/lipoyl-containing protein [Fibrobacteria bacterium]
MAIELVVPKVGESITEVQIVEWLKAEGDSVERDGNIAVIETDKATVELPAPASGTLTKVLKGKGATAKVGEVIGYL